MYYSIHMYYSANKHTLNDQKREFIKLGMWHFGEGQFPWAVIKNDQKSASLDISIHLIYGDNIHKLKQFYFLSSHHVILEGWSCPIRVTFDESLIYGPSMYLVCQMDPSKAHASQLKPVDETWLQITHPRPIILSNMASGPQQVATCFS